MRLTVFSVRDQAVERFLPPMYFRSMGEALRTVGDACADPGHQFAQHGEDFWLYRVGEFDDETGKFELEDAPVFVAKCSELGPKPNPMHARLDGSPVKIGRNNGPVVSEDPADEAELI